MPTVREDLDIQGNRIELKIEFEMWCKNCGAGICGNTDYIRSTTNGFVTHCPDCDSERDELKKENDRLEDELSDLRAEVDDLKSQLDGATN